jgi:hypothetical protein
MHDRIDLAPPSSAPEDFVAALESSLAESARSSPPIERWIELAGRVIALELANDEMAQKIWPALEPARRAVDGRVQPALRVRLWDSRTTGIRMVARPWSESAFVERGEIRGFNDERYRTAYNLGSEILSVYDHAARRAYFWTPDARTIPYWETANPLRSIFAWWLEHEGVQTVHAAGIARGDDGLLLTGRGGSGKSTTALLAVRAGFEYAGDNNVAIEPAPGAAGENVHVCHPLYDTASVHAANLDRLPHLRAHVRNAGRPDEKSLVFMRDAAPGRAARSFRIRAILLPRVTRLARTVIARATASQALLALAPSTIFSIPLARELGLRRLGAFVRTVPAFDLALAPDVDRIPALLDELLGSLRAEQGA